MSDTDPISEQHDCGADAAAYVLGALEPHERSAFLAHLEQCSICREEVESLTGVVQALPMATTQFEVPRGLRRRVMRSVRQSSPAIGKARVRGLSAAAERLAGWIADARLAVAGGTATLAGAIAVAVVVLSSGGGATLIQARVTGVKGTAQLRVQNGQAELVVRHMTSPGRGHIYEVWLQSGAAAPVPASVLFSVNSSGNADVTVPKRIRGTESVLVTREPLGGTPAPTSSPVISATTTV